MTARVCCKAKLLFYGNADNKKQSLYKEFAITIKLFFINVMF